MFIRRACVDDIEQIENLLFQVHKVHSDIRPDLFVPGGKKYTYEQIEEIISDDEKPVFVCVDGADILGYAFCVFERVSGDGSAVGHTTLYIDDLCVDEKKRGSGVGTFIYNHVVDFAKKEKCYNVTLNVWEGNDNAKSFYEKCGFKVLKTGMEKIL